MLEQIILILLAIIFLIALPILATIKYWNFKPLIKYALILIWISYGVISYEVFFPRDSYYVNHLTKASDINFSEDIKIIDKYTSLMNSKARYYSCASFEINEMDKKLFSTLGLKNSEIIKPLEDVNKCSKILNPFFSNSSLKRFKKVDEKNYREWGFIENTNRVYFIYKFYGMANKQ